MKKLILPVALLFAVPAFAQGTAAPAAPAAAYSAVGTTRNVWEGMASNVLKSAEQMPEADYSFKPVATVRSFGQVLGHVAGAERMFCAAVLGEPMKAEDDIEKTVTSKAGLVAALKESAAYCARAYAIPDAQAAGTVKFFGGDQSKMWILTLNAAHVGEHYGNLVTYLRVKGMVPPSSQGR
jgi:uncharacterized damage-inducible protein DinB